MEGFFSFNDARLACSNDETCKGIFDVNCEGRMFWTCRGNFQTGFVDSFDVSGRFKSEQISTCAWEKGITFKMTLT